MKIAAWNYGYFALLSNEVKDPFLKPLLFTAAKTSRKKGLET